MKRLTKRELVINAYDAGIEVKQAASPKDALKIAVHLLNPTVDELADGIWSAERDMFTTIYIHTKATWPGGSNV